MNHLLRPMPTETVSGLTPPLTQFPYFSAADQFRFQPRPGGFSSINAWWLAEASFLVYGGAEFIEQTIERTALPQLGFKLEWIGDRNDNGGMVLSNDHAMVVVFRGTRMHQYSVLDAAELVLIDQDDLWTDSKFLPAACPAGGMVHHGFLSRYAEIAAALDAVITGKSETQALWLTGHSLGGALAVVAATHFNNQSIEGVYTYGAPRVGNQEFATLLPDPSHQRFVHRDDWVATVPPELLGYRHGGTLRRLEGSGKRSFLDDVASGTQSLVAAAKSMARELKIDVGQLPMKVSGLADHAPIYYATLLWNSLIAEVETKSS